MTEKLYYQDAYIKEFDARVLSATPTDGGFEIILDRTAFFPEEGGQSADTGYIGNARVITSYERGGDVVHLTDKSPDSDTVRCTLDFADRYEKMQCHTAEHILCGIIHRLFGLENVGFHLGADVVTFDVSAPLTRAELDRVEELANEAVFANHEITTLFPTPDELSGMQYRSKLDLTENVRIVNIGDVDSCACCAPHVAHTGEIGLIKILDFMKHRGGLRIWMVAGRRALADYRKKYSNLSRISAMLSTPCHDTADTLEKYMSDTENLKYELRMAGKRLSDAYADATPEITGNLVKLIPGVGIDELRGFINSVTSRVSGVAVALTGTDGDYKYVIASQTVNLSSAVKEYNAALCGRGGGKPNMVQGSFAASLSEIAEYFK